jgi:DNA-binding response OmpR family regulator
MTPILFEKSTERADEMVKPYTILLIDDEDYIIKFLSILLRAHGYQVLTAGNGVKALNITRSGIIDLVVTDLLMPGLDGVGLIKQIRLFSKTLPVIVVSACESDGVRIRALESGADDFFPKPFDPKMLIDSIAARLPVRR